MAIWWIKAKLADREIAGRSYAERRAALVRAVRENSRSFADIQPEEGLATFFIFRPGQPMPKLSVAIREAIGATDDIVYGGILKVGEAQRYGAVLHEEERESIFDDMWRR